MCALNLVEARSLTCQVQFVVFFLWNHRTSLIKVHGGLWRTLLSMLMVTTTFPMVRLISLVPMKAEEWVPTHLGMQHGNLIHHKFLEIMKLKLVVIIMSMWKIGKVPSNNVGNVRKKDIGILHGRRARFYCSRSITKERIWHGMWLVVIRCSYAWDARWTSLILFWWPNNNM